MTRKILTARDGGRGHQPDFDEMQDMKAGRYPVQDPYDAMIFRSVVYGWILVSFALAVLLISVAFWAVGAATERPNVCHGFGAAECSAAVVGEL